MTLKSDPTPLTVRRARASLLDVPGDARSQQRLAAAALRKGQLAEALSAASRCLMMQSRISGWVRQFVALLVTNRRWDQLIAIGGLMVNRPDRIAEDTTAIATALQNAGKAVAARRDGSAAAIIDPSNAEWVLLIAERALAGRADQRAMRHLRHARVLTPDHPTVWKRLAGLAARSGDSEREFRALKAGLLTDPGDAILLERHAHGLGRTGAWRAGAGALGWLAAVDPDRAARNQERPWHHETIANAHLRALRFREAIRPFRRAAVLRPGLPRPGRALARCLLEDGRLGEAVRQFTRSVLMAEGTATGGHHGVRGLRIEAPRHHAERHGQPYLHVGDAFPVIVRQAGGAPAIRYTVPDRFVLMTEGARVIDGMYWPVTPDGSVLVEGLSYHQRRREDFGPFFKYVGERGDILAKLPQPGAHLRGPAAILGGGGNYYHCIIDWFSRLPVLEQCADCADIPLVVAPNIPPSGLDWLRLLGINRDRLVVSPAPYFDTDQLWLASMSHGRYGEVSPTYLDYLEDRVLAAWRDRTAPGRRRLFLSRHLTDHRHLANMDALRPTLARLGFEVVAPESLPLSAQIDLFADAAVIVGTFGAGLTNIIAAPAGTPVVELTHAGALRTMFAILAGLRGLPFHRVTGQAMPTGERLPIHYDFTVEPDRLERTLRSVLDG